MRIGEKIQDAKVMLTGNQSVNLSEYKGRRLVLYFYPKDNTPGCTLEAEGFRDASEALEALNAAVLGVSKDTVACHDKFKEKHGLPFQLVSDPDGSLHGLFDTWKLKKMMGREYMGTERSTFVIDEDGVLLKEWRKVSVPGHVEEVLEYLRSLK